MGKPREGSTEVFFSLRSLLFLDFCLMGAFFFGIEVTTTIRRGKVRAQKFDEDDNPLSQCKLRFTL